MNACRHARQVEIVGAYGYPVVLTQDRAAYADPKTEEGDAALWCEDCGAMGRVLRRGYATLDGKDEIEWRSPAAAR